jgi:hypothetical protein
VPAIKTKTGLCLLILAVTLAGATGDQPNSQSDRTADTQEIIRKLADQVAAQEVRIRQLEERLAQQGSLPAMKSQSAAEAVPTAPATVSSLTEKPQSPEEDGAHDHMIDLPGGGPVLKIRGFFDFNFGVGTAANPLIFPLSAPAHTTFQAGEIDLFMTSKLTKNLNFLSEIAIGTDSTNAPGIDIERVQLTYHRSKYFEVSAGRYHTSIGYYNTAFHHGTWFQTATGRPFMYFFEDSGGILPVHSVGVTMNGLVPGTGKLGLHWIAEAGNGRGSTSLDEPVQLFLADKNHKDFNLAAYVRPEWIHGLQVGGSYYRDRMVPRGIPHVEQNIESLYAVYITPTWEFMNEGVVINNRIDGQSKVFHTPLFYTQLSRKFGRYRPYFRYQYVNSPLEDPVNIFTGRYMGPSVGVRMDFTPYAAFKLQYNHLDRFKLDQLKVLPANGLDAQLAFTF